MRTSTVGISARLTRGERALIDEAIRDTGGSLSDWVRRALLMAAGVSPEVLADLVEDREVSCRRRMEHAMAISHPERCQKVAASTSLP